MRNAENNCELADGAGFEVRIVKVNRSHDAPVVLYWHVQPSGQQSPGEPACMIATPLLLRVAELLHAGYCMRGRTLKQHNQGKDCNGMPPAAVEGSRELIIARSSMSKARSSVRANAPQA